MNVDVESAVGFSDTIGEVEPCPNREDADSTLTNQYVGDPWTLWTEMKMRQNPNVQLISLLTDEAGAILIAKGIVPAYLRQQAKECLDLVCDRRTLPPRTSGRFSTTSAQNPPSSHKPSDAAVPPESCARNGSGVVLCSQTSTT